MKVEKAIVVNIGNYQSLRLGVSDAPSFEDCDQVIIAELERLRLPINDKVTKALAWGVDLSTWM